MRAYYYKNQKYNRFSELLSTGKFSVDDLNFKSVLHFLCFGQLHFNHTLLNDVNKTFDYNRNILDKKTGLIPVVSKNLQLRSQALPKDTAEHFITFFSERLHHLKTRNVTLDLTGGVDSRLLAVLFHHFEIPFEAFYSMDSGDHEELKIVKRVAESLNIPLTIAESPEVNGDKVYDELFHLVDGHFDIRKVISLRNIQKQRKMAGFDTLITGIGGAFFKDFFWQQDFPFYNKKTVNFERLFNIRMHFLDIHSDWLGERIRPLKDFIKSDFINAIKTCRQDVNSRTYDQIYFQIKDRELCSLMSAASSEYLTVYSPLYEQEVLDIGYNLPRKQRFLNQFHREIISRLNPEVSKIRTTSSGMSVSNRKINVLRDSLFFFSSKSVKLMKKIRYRNQEESRKNVKFQNNFLIEKCRDSIQALKEHDILSLQAPANPESYPSLLQGRLMTLGYLIKKIDQENSQ